MTHSRFRLSFIHLAALWAFAVVQPVLDLIGRFPVFLVAHGVTTVEVAGVVAAGLLGPPVILYLVVLMIRRVNVHAAAIAEFSLVALAAGVVALAVARQYSSVDGWPALGLACGLGGTAGWIYWRSAVARGLVGFLALGILVFPAIFFARPGVRASLARPEIQGLPAVEVAGEAPVFLVVFDELPAIALLDEHGDIDPVRFPAFASLAREGLWFRNAFTVVDFTAWALPAILTGRYPDFESIPTAGDHPRSLYTLLGGHYQVRAFEAMTALCPDSICQTAAGASRPSLAGLHELVADLGIVTLHLVVPRRWAVSLPPISENWAGFALDASPSLASEPEDPERDSEHHRPRSDDRRWIPRWNAGRVANRRAQFEAFLHAVSDQNRVLYVIHTLLPHAPYWYLPNGRRYDVDRRVAALEEDRWARERWSVAQAERRHLLQVGFSDHLLGRLLERLREVGVYDRALIVVTSDHGAAFIPGQQRRNLKAANLGEVLPVPLFVKLPGQGPTGARDRTSLTIDILPTIADVVGARIPWPVDGHSLLRDSTQRDSVYVKVSAQQEKGALRLGVPELLAERDDAAARRQARWHSGSWTSVFQYGPRESLVGRKVAELAVVGRAPSGIIVRRQDPPEDERSFTPILMSGVAVGDAGRQPLDLAIALHGTIRATARTYRQVGEAGGMVWQVLIEESALRPGPNPSEIFVVEGPDDSPRLLRVGRPSQSDLHE